METERKIYTIFAILTTGTALILVCLIVKLLLFGEIRTFKDFVLRKPVLFAWLLLLLPNITVSTVYFVEHMQIMITSKQAESSAWCSFVAFTAIVAMVCLNGSSLTVALTMYQIVMSGTKSVWSTVIYGNTASWFSGLGIGCWYLQSGAIGPYRGLYCCIRGERYNGPRIFVIFGSFAFSIFAQSYLYYRSFLQIRKTEEKARSSGFRTPVSRPRPWSPAQSSESTVQTLIQTPSVSRAFMKKGILLVSIYYFCWAWISVDALLVFSGFESPLWSSIVGALLAKMNSGLHCIIIIYHILKAKRVAIYVAR